MDYTTSVAAREWFYSDAAEVWGRLVGSWLSFSAILGFA